MRRITTDMWATLGVLAVMAIGTGTFVYMPQENELRRIRTMVASKNMVIEAHAQEAAVVPAMERQIAAIKNRYKDFDRRMPKRKELAGFLKEISGILAAENLVILNTEPRSPNREKLFHNLPISMKLRGSYLSLASLLKQIDKMERLTRIQKLSVSKDPKSDTQDLNIELQMNIYFTES